MLKVVHLLNICNMCTYRPNYLFDVDSLLQRPLPDQQEFQDEYKDILAAMPGIFQTALEKTLAAQKKKHPASINKNWFANEMSGNIEQMVKEKFPQYVKNVRGTYCLFLDSKYECYVKKLRSDSYRPSYKHSNTSWANVNQKAEQEDDQIPVIFIGYTVNKSNDLITGSYATCINGKKKLWRTDLNAISRANQQNIPHPVTTTEKEVVVEPKVLPKKQKEA